MHSSPTTILEAVSWKPTKQHLQDLLESFLQIYKWKVEIFLFGCIFLCNYLKMKMLSVVLCPGMKQNCISFISNLSQLFSKSVLLNPIPYSFLYLNKSSPFVLLTQFSTVPSSHFAQITPSTMIWFMRLVITLIPALPTDFTFLALIPMVLSLSILDGKYWKLPNWKTEEWRTGAGLEKICACSCPCMYCMGKNY